MTHVHELDCPAEVRNAVIRNISSHLEDLSDVCACDIRELRNIGWRRVWQLQQALVKVGRSLRPCRYVAKPVERGRRREYQHQDLVLGEWRTPDGPVYEPTEEQPAHYPLDHLEEHA